MNLTPRKLLSAAALATLAACGHAAPGVRATTMPTPQVEAVANVAPAATPPAPAPAQTVFTAMCDANGRPLAGNVRTKNAQSMADCGTVTASR